MGKQINFLQAICHAVFWKKETPQRPEEADDVQRITEKLKNLEILGHSDLKAHLEKAKESLEEVKKLTEYQDQKVARLLTIIAFLTAAASTIFSRAFETYPLHQDFSHSGIQALVILFYASFAAYLIVASLGALVSFYAMQTRFIWNNQEGSGNPKSFLFFQGIASTSPEAWADAFLSNSGRSLSSAIFNEYYKNYIAESYLVALKIKDKLQYLQPGQQLLQIAIKLLILWFIALFSTLALVPRASIQGDPKISNPRSVEISSVSKSQVDGATQPAQTSSAPLAAPAPSVKASDAQRGQGSD